MPGGGRNLAPRLRLCAEFPPVARKAGYYAAGRALTLDPGNARAFAALAILQLGDRRFDEAISSAHRAVTLNPNDAEAAANLAFVLAYSGQTAGAVTAIEQALGSIRRRHPVSSCWLVKSST